MAKVIENIKTYDETIKVGDLVVVNTHTGTDPICIVTAICKEKKIITSPTATYVETYDCTALKDGHAFNSNGDAVKKYHGTITLSNE